MRKKNSLQYHSQKHPNTRGPHTVTPLQIMKFTPTPKRREICCVDKMGRERKIGKSRKEKKKKKVRRGFKEKEAAIWELKRRVLRFVVIWERKKKTKKITLYFGK